MITGRWSKIFEQTLGWNMSSDHVQCHVFGEMVKLANPLRMSANVSDLFHDAEWVMAHVDAAQLDQHFFYGVRPTGTDIDRHLEPVRENTDVYRFVVVRRNESERGSSNSKHVLTISRWEQD